jgi:hypothetical protein
MTAVRRGSMPPGAGGLQFQPIWIFNVRARLLKVACMGLMLMFLAGGTSGKGNLQPATPVETYNAAVREAQAGHSHVALRLFEKAAKHNVLAAQIQLARIYASGVGGPRDDVKALEYYRRVAEPNEDIDRASYLAPYVGEAFVAIGRYYRTGLPAAGLPENKDKAARLFLQAAGNFMNADAQYELAMLYLNGDGVDKNPRLAVLWLGYSAQKRHALAQAEAGDLLWKGQLVKQARDRGLALLALARDNASPEELPLIEIKFRNAVAEADNETLLRAEAELKKLAPTMRTKTEGVLRIMPGAASDPPLIMAKPLPEPAPAVEVAKGTPAAGAPTVPSLNGR